MFNSGPRSSLAVCIKPLSARFGDSLRLVEFIELYKILGATHFVFYVFDVGNDVHKVLREYQKRREATLMR